MPMTSKEMIRLLWQNGFEVVSQNGSHVKLKNPTNGRLSYRPKSRKGAKKGAGASYFETDQVLNE